MAWPSNASAYSGRVEAARAAWAGVARAISRFEPVVMLANDADLVVARTLCGPAIEVRRVAIVIPETPVNDRIICAPCARRMIECPACI
jgi:agmatine deiminase